MIPADFPGNTYLFRFIREEPPYSPGGFLLERYICPFKTKKGRHYIIQVEQYQHHIYVLKFYLKEHRYQQDPEPKYYFQTNDGPAEAIRILNTCLSVMLYLLKRDPLASGGFIGTPKPEEGANATNSQRFRIYSQLACDFFPPERWEHQHSPETNAYLLLNKAALGHYTTPTYSNKSSRCFRGFTQISPTPSATHCGRWFWGFELGYF